MNIGRGRYPQGKVVGTMTVAHRITGLKEGFPLRSVVLSVLQFPFMVFVFGLIIGALLLPLLDFKILGLLWVIMFFTAISIIMTPFILPLFYSRRYLSYSLGDGYIYVKSGGFMPLMGKVIFIDDIKRIRPYRSFLMFNMYIGRERRYFNNSFAPAFQDRVYLIDLEHDHKIVHKQKVMHRPEPGNWLQRYFMNTWYPDRFPVPEHIIKRYIDEGLKGSGRLKFLIGE